MSDKSDKKTVFVKANFLKVSDINTIKEEFVAEVVVAVRWREPALDNTKDLKSADLNTYWNPKIIINNTAPSTSLKRWKTAKSAKNGDAYIIEKLRLKGVFSENMELHEFPFDIQDLSVAVTSELTTEKVDIIEDDEEISAVNVSCFVDETEWTICDLVYSEPKVVSRESESQCKNPLLNVRCCAIRKAGFFMYNIILIMTMITTLSFTTFAVDVTLTQNRLQLSFIVLLTGVTFKLASNQSLPKIPYLTHLEIQRYGDIIIQSSKYVSFETSATVEPGQRISNVYIYLYVSDQSVFTVTYIRVTGNSKDLPLLKSNCSVVLLTQDRYILGGMAFNWLVCVWHAIVSRYDHLPDYQMRLDFWAFITLIIIYALFQVVFYVLVLIKRIIRSMSVSEKEKAYQEKAARLMGSTWKKERKERLHARHGRRRVFNSS